MRRARPCDFEHSQQSGASQHADAERLHESDLGMRQHRLDPAEDDDEEVEAVEHRAEVRHKADRVHLDKHLDRKQRDEEHVGDVCSHERNRRSYQIRTTINFIQKQDCI